MVALNRGAQHREHRQASRANQERKTYTMIKIEQVEVNGKTLQGIAIQAPGGEGHPNMLVMQGKKGYIMCGYLNMETAEKVGDAAAVIGGSCFEELLENPVKAVSKAAAELGIAVGMSGAEAAAKLND